MYKAIVIKYRGQGHSHKVQGLNHKVQGHSHKVQGHSHKVQGRYDIAISTETLAIQ